MHIAIAGGHGQIALLLARRLTARGDTVLSLVRNRDHLADVEQTGASAVVCDLEAVTAAALAERLQGVDAVVFAAGAGPNSGVARKDSVDRAAAVLLADAAEAAGVRRYLLVSSMGVDAELSPDTDEVWAAYLHAKKAAEQAIRARRLDWTVLRPGRLTDEPATGLVTLAAHAERGAISREDVAAVLVGLLDTPASAGHTLELVGGTTPLTDALGF
jgi:uncharacterized protein YbjT (DUF2867 family)